MKTFVDLDAGSARYGQLLAENVQDASVISVVPPSHYMPAFMMDIYKSFRLPPLVGVDSDRPCTDDIKSNRLYQDQQHNNHQIIVDNPIQFAIRAASEGMRFDRVSHNFPGEKCIFDNQDAYKDLISCINDGGELIFREYSPRETMEKYYEKRFKQSFPNSNGTWERNGFNELTKEDMKLHDLISAMLQEYAAAEFRFRKVGHS